MTLRTIDKYLVSTCLFVIDDFNAQYKNIEKPHCEKMRLEANTGYTEADLVVRIGYPFRQMANFIMQSSLGKKNESNQGNDIVIKDMDFRIEVKYVKQNKSEGMKFTNHANWGPIEKDFNWLIDEMQKGNKGKRAFIIGWFNCVDTFADQIQLGERQGRLQTIDLEKIKFFPFLSYDPKSKNTKTVAFRYDNAFLEFPLNIPNLVGKPICCLFLGEPEDKFHIALYY